MLPSNCQSPRLFLGGKLALQFPQALKANVRPCSGTHYSGQRRLISGENWFRFVIQAVISYIGTSFERHDLRRRHPAGFAKIPLSCS